MRSIEAALRGAAIFAHLNDRQIGRLAGLATLQEFPAAARIVRRGDSGMALYIIVRGRVLVTVDSEQDATVKRLGELGAGEVFGELALIDEGPRSADVTALEATECVLLTR